MTSAQKNRVARDDRWLSLPKAAAELRKSRQGVLIAIAKGELEAEQVAGRVVVSRESVQALKTAEEAKDG